MAFNGSGVFERLFSWAADKAANIKIRADRMDQEMNGFATGLSNCITRDGQTTVTQNLPLNGKRLMNIGAPVDDDDAVSLNAAMSRFAASFGVSATAAANALTVALLTPDGSTPATDDKVPLRFRSSDPTLGTLIRRDVAAETKFTVSYGSTLGVPAANAPFSLYAVAFDDGGTIRIGIVNSDTIVLPGIASSTAEGGAGAADSAAVFYTDAAVTSKAYVPLARLNWANGLAALGTWTSPSSVDVFGMPSPLAEKSGGVLVSSGKVTSSVAAVEISIPARFKAFRINYRGVRPTLETGYLGIQVRRGGVWQASPGNYAWENHYYSQSSHTKWGSGDGSTISNMMAIASAFMSATAVSMIGHLDFVPGDADFYPQFKGEFANGQLTTQNSGFFGSIGRIDGVRFLFTTGNVARFEYDLIGLGG